MASVFLETTGDRHAWLVGGVSALERRIREFAKAGCDRAIVAAEPVEFPRELPIPVEFVAPGTKPPDGAQVERADMIAGMELVDEDTRKRAEWALIRTMNKKFEGPVDALINWRFSMRITHVLCKRSLAVTPNHVTIVSILLGIAAAIVAQGGSYLAVAFGGVMIQTNSVLDSVDGELARLRFQYSKLGQWLDNVGDDIVDNGFIAACGIAIGGVWQWLALATALARVAASLAQYIDVYRRTGTGDVFAFRYWFEIGKATATEVYDPKQITTWLRAFGRRDTYTFVWMIACLAGFPYWVVAHGMLIGGVTVSTLLVHFLVFRGRAPGAASK